MAVNSGLQKAADFAKVSEIDFVSSFGKSIRVLQEVLGITRKIEKKPGQNIKTYHVTGELADGTVAEGEDIPLSKYKTEVADVFELRVKKWAKQTSLEAINDKTYEQAVTDTDTKMLGDIHAGMRTEFFDFLKSPVKMDGTASAGTATSGKGLQGALAMAWGQLQVLCEDEADTGYLYFVNPLDIAEYLSTAEITTQTAFGMTYIKGFLGIYDVVSYSDVPRGKVIATPSNNIVLYHMNPKNSDLAKVFDFTVDKTGYVGVHHETEYGNMTTKTYAISGTKLFGEIVDYIVTSAIEAAAPEPAPVG